MSTQKARWQRPELVMHGNVQNITAQSGSCDKTGGHSDGGVFINPVTGATIVINNLSFCP